METISLFVEEPTRFRVDLQVRPCCGTCLPFLGRRFSVRFKTTLKDSLRANGAG